MPRLVKDSRLETRTARARLAPRGRPYWRALDPGLRVGYRKGQTGGRWVVRWYLGNEKYQAETLDGIADDTQDANGSTILDYAGAVAAARALHAQRTGPAAAGSYTVARACEAYKADYERRGGRGLNGMHTKEEDWVEHLFIASTHDYVMFFADSGKVYWLKVYDIPQMGRAAKGKPVVNCIAITPDERIASLVNVREFAEDKYLVFATRNGTVKKTRLAAYGNVRSTGIIAINIEEGDAEEAIETGAEE